MKEQFDRIVANGFEFLLVAMEDLEKRPRLSTVHFYAAIELFVKARLLLEHWSLVVVKPETANRDKFLAGDFQSVGLEDARKRLLQVVNEDFPDAAFKCFDNLRKERNKIVHFYHPTQSGDIDARVQLRKVVAQQCKAWFFLHRLLSRTWRQSFEELQDQVEGFDAIMLRNSSYLDEKLAELQPEMADAMKQGAEFLRCPSCQRPAFEKNSSAFAFDGECRVCELAGTAVIAKCRHCETPTVLVNEAYGTCPDPRCAKALSPDDVIEAFEVHVGARGNRPSEDEYANCAMCAGEELVVPVEEQWFCTQCFEIYDLCSVKRCSYCQQLGTYVPEDSYLMGCEHCEGSLAKLHEQD